MKTILKYSFLALTLSLTVASAHAAPTTAARTAPEVDPTLAISGLALLVGSLSVAHARRSKG